MWYPFGWNQQRVEKSPDWALEEEVEDTYLFIDELEREARDLEWEADDCIIDAQQDKVEPEPSREFQASCIEQSKRYANAAHETRVSICLMHDWANFIKGVLEVREALASRPWASWEELAEELDFTDAERRELAWCFV